MLSDDGCGMSPQIRRQAFDPFFTTRRHEGATGLGLHIVHSMVVDRLDGRLALTSEPGVGTTVRLILPRSVRFESELRESLTRSRPGATVPLISIKASRLPAKVDCSHLPGRRGTMVRCGTVLLAFAMMVATAYGAVAQQATTPPTTAAAVRAGAAEARATRSAGGADRALSRRPAGQCAGGIDLSAGGGAGRSLAEGAQDR